MKPRLLAALLLFATSAFAQSADLTLTLSSAPAFNAGELATVKATVTNLGPDAATAAGVRLKKPFDRFVAPGATGCIDLPDAVLCSVPVLGRSESHEFTVPFYPPPFPGPITLTARAESFTVDPNHDNDGASVDANVVHLVDLATTIETYPSLQPGKESGIGISVREQAARIATGIRVSVTIPPALQVVATPSNCDRAQGDAGSYTCAIQDLDQTLGGRAQVAFTVVPRTASGSSVTISASAVSSIDEWNPADNHVTSVQTVFAIPDLVATLTAPEALDASNHGTLKIVIENPTDIAAPSTTVDIGQFGPGTIVSSNAPGWSCHVTSAFTMWCSIPSLQAHSSSTIDVELQYPAHEIRSGIGVQTTQTPPIVGFRSQPQNFRFDTVFYRTFDVTSVADSGTGSLRQAIIDSNAQCTSTGGAPPCRIAFRIPAPVPNGGWFTIEPLSPLPEITSNDFAIDGETQTALTGNTNPLGPEIDLTGRSAGDTDGIILMTGLAAVRGLAIGGFARSGILSVPTKNVTLFNDTRRTIERNYIGVDPTGRVADPNGLRGIHAYYFIGRIADNVISGNRRSGAFLTTCDDSVITGNRIGVAAASDDPLPNGAAGLFFLDTNPFFEVKIQGNVIEFNGEHGVSTSQRTRISLFDNVIAHNRTQIDQGLDGPTPGFYGGEIAPQPLVTSARFDGQQTIIEGIAPRVEIGVYRQSSTVYLYANGSGDEGAEQFIGTAAPDSTGHFTLTVPRDLRGKYIDATTYLTIDFGDFIIHMSSELGPSAAVP
jgi:copper-binding protein NosD